MGGLRRDAVRWIVAGLCAAVCGCGPGSPLAVRLDAQTSRPAPRAVLFFCDGVSVDLLRQGCREGWLPNLERHFLKRGTQVVDAFTTIPSLTFPTMATVMTGQTPARHGIVGNRWFEPATRRCRDYLHPGFYRHVNSDLDVRTLAEHLAPASTATIQLPLFRGSELELSNALLSGLFWFIHGYNTINAIAAGSVTDVAAWANRRGELPELLVIYLPATDLVAHASGVDSGKYRWAMQRMDEQVGAVCGWMERQGLLEETYLLFVSDHGFVTVNHGRVVDVPEYCRKVLGRRVTQRLPQGESDAARRAHFDRHDAVFVAGDTRVAMLYLASAGGWDQRATAEQLRAILDAVPAGRRLWELDGVRLVALRGGEGQVTLLSRGAEARIIEQMVDGEPHYRLEAVEGDVLGYGHDPALAEFIAAGAHSSRAWLEATAGQTYPDVVPHLVPLMASPRTGDVLIFAATGYGFESQRSSHGGLHRDECRMPLIFAGPGVPAGATVPVARACDVAPTLLRLFGRAERAGELEGQAIEFQPARRE